MMMEKEEERGSSSLYNYFDQTRINNNTNEQQTSVTNNEITTTEIKNQRTMDGSTTSCNRGLVRRLLGSSTMSGTSGGCCVAFIAITVVAFVVVVVSFIENDSWNIRTSAEQEVTLDDGNSLTQQQSSSSSSNQRRKLSSTSRRKIKVFQPHPSIFGQPLMDNNIATMMTTSNDDDIEFEHVIMTLEEQRLYILKHGKDCYGSSINTTTKKNHSTNDNDEDINMILDQWDAFENMKPKPLVTLQIELWKHCILYNEGGLFIEAEALLLQPLYQVINNTNKNIAIVSNVYKETIFGGWLYISSISNETSKATLQSILDILIETNVNYLSNHPLYFAEQSYQEIFSNNWELWNQSCYMDPLPVQQQQAPSQQQQQLQQSKTTSSIGSSSSSEFGSTTTTTTSYGEIIQPSLSHVLGPIGSQVYVPKYHRLLEHCPRPGDYCCSIYKSSNQDSISTNSPTISIPVFMSRHSMVPFRVIPSLDELSKPYMYHYQHKNEEKQKENNNNNVSYTKADVDNLPYMSTVREETYKKPKNYPLTPNFYDILHQNDCVPSDKTCSDCLRNKKGSTCQKCTNECPCFCKSLCHTDVPKKFISKTLYIYPPTFKREVNRIIPRIIHQTWFEPVTSTAYPNMSRLIESWKQSGWEYRFYDDNAIESFLKLNFPIEIYEAYDALIPGAFKADLFRYCVLLIYGGIYADMDVLLESNLEVSVPKDVGFLTPVDEPGRAVNKRMCLWNGLIAVAPAHPFMARTIQNVVNAIRNRYTSVDSDHRLCTSTKNKPELSVSHAWDTLFTAGPCIMGQSINEVLGRNQQQSYEPGLLSPTGYEVQMEGTSSNKKKSTTTVTTTTTQLPGRSIILSQNKEDMGAHRFTLLESNLLVAATDMPDYDDRQYTPKEETTVVDGDDTNSKDDEGTTTTEDNTDDSDDGDESQPAAAGGGGAHYSETHVKVGVYGLKGLYKDTFVSANADISLVIMN